MLNVNLLIISIVFLSLAMNKHYKDTFNVHINKPLQLILKVIGWSALVLSLFFLPTRGIEYLLFCCQLSIIILIQSLLLSLIKNKIK